MGFHTPKYGIADLLKQVGSGKIQLPDFQRGYRWDDERIRLLLVTISLGYPLGVIMLLRTGGQEVWFKPKPIEGTVVDSTIEPEKLLLDGQQRLTSLYQALSGAGIVDTKDSRDKIVRRRYYLHIATALAGDTERDKALVSVPGDGKIKTNFDRDVTLDLSTAQKEQSLGYFPLRLAYDPAAAMSWLIPVLFQEDVQRFHAEVLAPMQGYEIPAIELEKETSKGAVATVFEKVNRGGLPLTVFELLTAMFAGSAEYFTTHGTDFRLRDDWEATKLILMAHPVLANTDENDFLVAVTLLASRAGTKVTTARRADILTLTLGDYLEWAPRIRAVLPSIAHFLNEEHIHSARDIPYQAQLTPLIAIWVLLGESADIIGTRERLRQWYWCGVLGEAYGSTTETKFARDVDEVPDWASADATDDAMIPTTIRDASFLESRLVSLRTRQSAAYKGIYALLMGRDCKDWKFEKKFDKAQYELLQVDIHHVFPKAWCIDEGIDPSHRESIVNKTSLAAKTNRSIGRLSPADYLPKLERDAKITSAQMDDLLRTHLIDPAALRAADFKAYSVARRGALLAMVELAMGKRAQRDMDASELVGGMEAPEAFEAQTDDPDDADDLDTATAIADDFSAADENAPPDRDS